MEIKRIIVGVDGSPQSVAAAEWAASLAQKLSAALTVLFVLEPPTAWRALRGATPRGAEVQEREEVDRFLQDLKRRFPDSALDVRAEFGAAAQTLLDQATAVGADLIVVGARGLSAGGAWLLGSVSDRVVHHASLPVVVIR
jgi:nucleotide-binding universal stress UspA family protein